MKKICLVFVIFISAATLLSAQNKNVHKPNTPTAPKYDTIVTSKEYYNFFDSVSNPGDESHWVLRTEPIPFNITNALDSDRILPDTMFKKADSAFLKYEVANALGFTWGAGLIPGATVANKSTIEKLLEKGKAINDWGQFENAYGYKEYWSYSVPLFSLDRTICVVKYTNHSDLGKPWGLVSYYKKTNGTWDVVYSYKISAKNN